MIRAVGVLSCLMLGVLLLGAALFLPAHLRALDALVVRQAGLGTPSLVDRGLELAAERRAGPAGMLGQAASQLQLSGAQRLLSTVAQIAHEQPPVFAWGMVDARVGALFWSDPKATNAVAQPLTETVLRLENRAKVMAYLRVSPSPVVQELMRTRGLTNTTLIPASGSPSGQAFDAAVSVCGLLLDKSQLSPGLSDALERRAAEANRGSDSGPLEQSLMDLLALGNRMNYGQLAAFLHSVKDVETLRILNELADRAGQSFPVLYAAVQTSGRASEVTKYLTTYSQSGLRDLGRALRLGTGGLKELLDSQKRLYEAPWTPLALRVQSRWARNLENTLSAQAFRWPWFLFATKCVLFFAGAFLFVNAIRLAWPAQMLVTGGTGRTRFHFARESLGGLALLLLLLLVSEPFIAGENQKVQFPFRLRVPSVAVLGAGARSAGMGQTTPASLMNELSLLTLALFFLLQALIYTACVIKLAEIRRQPLPARIKLKLLDNEDHLFDAGLYLGFAGTIVSLIMVSLGVIRPSLMAAYSSTSFGIVFVSIFKIFHLRGARRKLLIEAEQDNLQSFDSAESSPVPSAS